MKITSAQAKSVELELKEPFAIASGSIEVADNIFIRLETDEGIVGWGCATPDPVTAETKESVLKGFEELKRVVVGGDPTRINHLNYSIESEFVGNPSIKAGLNIAFFDILGKKANLPLYKLLGGYRQKIETSVTIGIDSTEGMIRKAKQLVLEGFSCLKIKCGVEVGKDAENILAIRKAVGPDIKLRLDANEGYSVDDALKLVKILTENCVEIEILEQPTNAAFLYSLKDVKTHSHIPIMADEAALTLTDSARLVKLEIADMINIKLMKIGGVTNAIKANAIADLGSVPIMVGCMNESMGAMSAGVHFACAFRNVQYADLDSALDFKEDIVKGGAIYKGGYVIPSEEPGLGIEVQL